jgi:hypothetical protein
MAHRSSFGKRFQGWRLLRARLISAISHLRTWRCSSFICPILRTQTDRARALPGYETHHIVERGPNEGKFSEEQLEGSENVVRIPYYKHRDISDFYSTKNKDLGGLTPREYLRGKSFEEQRQFGIETLKRFKVIK